MSEADQKPQSSLADLLAEWGRMEQVEVGWVSDAEQRNDGCNAHAHRKAARIYRQCAEALAALGAAETGQGCASCVHWMADKPDRRRKDRYGTCVAAQCYTDFQVNAPGWCPECDPYSMNEAIVRTRSDFRCNHFKGQPTPPRAQPTTTGDDQ